MHGKRNGGKAQAGAAPLKSLYARVYMCEMLCSEVRHLHGQRHDGKAQLLRCSFE